MVLLLLNDGTMSRVPDVYLALCNLQSASPSFDPQKKPVQGRMGAAVPVSFRMVKQLAQGHTAGRQHSQGRDAGRLTPPPALFPCSHLFCCT